VTSLLPENIRTCISKIREAFRDCPRPTRALLSPNSGLDGPYVHKNWRHLSREDVEALDFFGSYLAEDITYMSSISFRYYVPSVMILFLSHPNRIDFGGFISMVTRFESALNCRLDGRCSDGQIATTRPQADAFHDWFGQVMTIIRKFDLGSFESKYMQRLRALRARLKTFTPDTDYDASTIQSSRQESPSSSKAEQDAAP